MSKISQRERNNQKKKGADQIKAGCLHFRPKKKQNSVHYHLEADWRRNGKSKGAYHGGQWNGKDAREAMKNPRKFYEGKRQILKEMKGEGVDDSTIDDLCNDVISLLSLWHDVFHLLRKTSPTPADKIELEKAIKKAVSKHREVGLSITPKVHLIEDHALFQYCNLPDGIAIFIEEFVEQNHQKGHQVEEQSKRIKNIDQQALCKANNIRARNNATIQQHIEQVNKGRSRGPYQRRDTKPSFVSPSPPKRQKKEESFSPLKKMGSLTSSPTVLKGNGGPGIEVDDADGLGVLGMAGGGHGKQEGVEERELDQANATDRSHP